MQHCGDYSKQQRGKRLYSILARPAVCSLYTDSTYAVLRLRLGSSDDQAWQHLAAGHLRLQTPPHLTARWLATTYTLECATEYVRQCLWCVGCPDRHETARVSHRRLRALIASLKEARSALPTDDPRDPICVFK